MNTKELLDPITPGEILREDFMEPMGLSINRLARDLVVPPNRISEIVNGKRAITVDTALRLQRYFKIEAQFWLNLQSEYDLRMLNAKFGLILNVAPYQRRICRQQKLMKPWHDNGVNQTANTPIVNPIDNL